MHSFVPIVFSANRSEYGISTVVKQTVTLRETAKINDRVFDRSECFVLKICAKISKFPQYFKCVIIYCIYSLFVL